MCVDEMCLHTKYEPSNKINLGVMEKCKVFMLSLCRQTDGQTGNGKTMPPIFRYGGIMIRLCQGKSYFRRWETVFAKIGYFRYVVIPLEHRLNVALLSNISKYRKKKTRDLGQECS